jgi:hypothetical protein
MNHFYEEIDEHIQWLINFMNEEYPNNYELVIDNNSGTIRSTLQAQMFLRNDLRNPSGFRKATEKPMNKFVEKLVEAYKKQCENICECWESCDHYAICNGTKERDMCHCGGDVKKCDFYPKKRGEQK